MLAAPVIVLVESGIDWLTATLPAEAQNAATWLNTCLEYLDTVVDEGNELEYRNLLGYSGVGAAGSFVGSREDGHMCVFSGHSAHQAFSSVYRADMHISRLDCQVTVKYDRLPKNTAKKGYRDAMAANNDLPVSRRRKIHIIVGSDGGDTVYVGSPTSDQRGCLYNKAIESSQAHYKDSWRYEVRFKGYKATAFAHKYHYMGENAVQWASDVVAIWYESRGIEAPWPYDENAAPVAPEKRVSSDVERKLNWLRKQVRPSIEYLLETCDRAIILEYLGLLISDTV